MICHIYSVNGGIIVNVPKAVRDINQYHIVCQGVYEAHLPSLLLETWSRYRRLWNGVRRTILIPLILINKGQDMTVIVDATAGVIRRESKHCDGWSIILHSRCCTLSELPGLVCVTESKRRKLRRNVLRTIPG